MSEKKLFGRKLCGYLLLWLLACCAQLVRAQENQLTTLSLSIRQELSSLKTETQLLQNDLANTMSLLSERSNDLRLSEQERQELQTQRTELYSSFLNMNERYNSLYSSYEKVLAQMQLAKKWAVTLALVLAAWILIKVVRIIVGLKFPALDVIIPRWIDIII